MKSGTLTVLPVSSIAGLVTLLAVSPRKPSGASTTLSCTEAGNSTWTGRPSVKSTSTGKIFDQIILRVGEQVLLERDRLVGARIHEMEAAVVLVTELERGPVDIDQFHLVGRTEADIGAFAGVDVTDDRLDKGAQVSRRAMMHFEDDGGVAIVFYCHSFAEIVCGGHGVELLVES